MNVIFKITVTSTCISNIEGVYRHNNNYTVIIIGTVIVTVKGDHIIIVTIINFGNGHSHGFGHGYGHGDGHGHSHSHGHGHGHGHDHGCCHIPGHGHGHVHGHWHNHGHMYGHGHDHYDSQSKVYEMVTNHVATRKRKRHITRRG